MDGIKEIVKVCIFVNTSSFFYLDPVFQTLN